MDLFAAVPQIILYQLTNPFIFVPGIVIGWLARSRAQLIGGAVLIAAIITVLSFLEPLPPGGQRVWGAIPIAVVGPLIWVFAVSALKTWMRREGEAAPSGGRLKIVRAVIGLVIGAALGAGIGLGLGFAAIEIFNISSFEGGAGYFVAFLFFVPGLLIGAIVGAVVGYRR